jgi:hypothetical protein
MRQLFHQKVEEKRVHCVETSLCWIYQLLITGPGDKVETVMTFSHASSSDIWNASGPMVKIDKVYYDNHHKKQQPKCLGWSLQPPIPLQL